MEVPLLSNPPGVRFFIFLNFFVKSGGDGGFVVLLGWPETCIVWARPGWPSGFLRGLSVTVLSLHEGDPLPASSSLPSLPVRSYRQHGLLSTLMMTTASCTHTADPSSWWMYGNVCMSICFFFFFPVAQRSLTCIQLVSEGRFWLGPDTWWYKSPLEFKGVPFVQAILQKAFKLNKSTDAPMFQNTAFTASYFISISYTVEWKWQNYLKMATSLGEHSNNHFHICWSLISLYLQWIREVCYVTRQVYYVLSPWGWDHEVQMTAAGLGVCTSWVKMWGQGMRLGLRGHTRSSSSHRNYLRAVFTSGDHRGPVSSCFSNRVD